MTKHSGYISSAKNAINGKGGVDNFYFRYSIRLTFTNIPDIILTRYMFHRQGTSTSWFFLSNLEGFWVLIPRQGVAILSGDVWMARRPGAGQTILGEPWCCPQGGRQSSSGIATGFKGKLADLGSILHRNWKKQIN